jgi:hypothetical protein
LVRLVLPTLGENVVRENVALGEKLLGEKSLLDFRGNIVRGNVVRGKDVVAYMSACQHTFILPLLNCIALAVHT